MSWFHMLKGTREELKDAIKEYNRIFSEMEIMRATGMHPNDVEKFQDLITRLDELKEYIDKLQGEE